MEWYYHAISTISKLYDCDIWMQWTWRHYAPCYPQEHLRRHHSGGQHVPRHHAGPDVLHPVPTAVTALRSVTSTIILFNNHVVCWWTQTSVCSIRAFSPNMLLLSWTANPQTHWTQPMISPIVTALGHNGTNTGHKPKEKQPTDSNNNTLKWQRV